MPQKLVDIQGTTTNEDFYEVTHKEEQLDV